MDWITTSGASIDEAKSNALDQLGIVADEAEFDIVNDVEKGLFGRIKTEAKIRARVRPKAPAAKDDRRRRGGQGSRSKSSSKNGKQNRGGGGRSRSGGGKSDRGKSGGGKSDRGDRSRSGAGKSGGGKSERTSGTPQKSAAPKDKGDRGRPAGDRPRAGRSDGDAPKSESRDQPTTAPESSDTRADTRPDTTRSDSSAEARNDVEHEYSREEQEQVAVRFLEGLIDVLEMSGSVALVEEAAEDGAIELAVNGEELGLLVGPKGATLNAVQELTRTVVQRESGGARTERLRVDVAGYRQRRTAALQEFARGIAQDVLDSGSEKILEPMGPADRKVVHDAVNEIDGVETGSEGEEPRRRVVIRPSD